VAGPVGIPVGVAGLAGAVLFAAAVVFAGAVVLAGAAALPGGFLAASSGALSGSAVGFVGLVVTVG
jgi:hypothetical protein